MRQPTSDIDYTSKDYEAFRTEIINGLQLRVPEYTDTSQNDAGIAIIEAVSERLDVLSYHLDSIANECFLTTCKLRSSAESWCNILGYTPYSSKPSMLMQCFKLFKSSTEDTLIPSGTIVKTLDGVLFETTEDLTIPSGSMGDEIREEYIEGSYINDGGISKYKYLVPVEQGYSVSLAYLGLSVGYPNSRYILKHANIIHNSVDIYVYNGSEYEKWTKVDSFINSVATSKHFTIKSGESGLSYVVFGDGNTGMIPTISSNPLYANYRVGGGRVGNVSANTITVCTSSDLQTVVKETFNPFPPIVFGSDAESLDSIKLNAPIYSSIKWGIVTLKDFDSFISINFPSKILSSYTEYDEINDIANIYTIINPAYSFDSLKSELLPIIQQHLILKGHCDMLEAIKSSTDMELSVTLRDTYSQLEVQSQVYYYVQDYFFEGSRLIGEEVVLSDLCDAIKKDIQGIKSIKFVSPIEDILTPNGNEVISLNTLTINMYGGIE